MGNKLLEVEHCPRNTCHGSCLHVGKVEKPVQRLKGPSLPMSMYQQRGSHGWIVGRNKATEEKASPEGFEMVVLGGSIMCDTAFWCSC